MGFLISCGSPQAHQQGEKSAPPEVAKSPLRYKTYDLSNSTVHTLVIPKNSGYGVQVASMTGVNNLNIFADKYDAIAIINGGFFDAANGKTTSYIIEDGKTVGDPKLNPRLMNNRDLAPYLNQIFNRSEFRTYLCGEVREYAIAPHNESVPAGCKLLDALGAGPRLLTDITAETEGFFRREAKRIVRDPIGVEMPNARSAIGITAGGDLILVMVAQKPDSLPNSGLSLPELADFLRSLGVKEALNLDGGSSSSFYFDGRTYYGKLDKDGQPIKRSVKSVLIVEKQ